MFALPPRALHQLLRVTLDCRVLSNAVRWDQYRHDQPARLREGVSVRVTARPTHPSHTVGFYRGVYPCGRCGYIAATTVRNLGERCTGCPAEGSHGAKCLAKIRELRPPGHLKEARGGGTGGAL